VPLTPDYAVDRSFRVENLAARTHRGIPAIRCSGQSTFLQHPVFNRYHSETEMLRYIKRLESRDLSLTASMIPLGSCTMKLNAAAEMFPVSWPEFARMHPFAPINQTRGYQMLFEQLETWLAEITGFAGISLQPNAGSQGEYAGLLVIRAYHESRGEHASQRLPHPDLRARHEPRQCRHGRNECRRRRVRHQRQH
jgi:glycine dehydrogenase